MLDAGLHPAFIHQHTGKERIMSVLQSIEVDVDRGELAFAADSKSTLHRGGAACSTSRDSLVTP